MCKIINLINGSFLMNLSSKGNIKYRIYWHAKSHPNVGNQEMFHSRGTGKSE